MEVDSGDALAVWRPCPEGSLELAEATKLVEAIDELVAELEPDSDVGGALAVFSELAASQCLAEEGAMPSTTHPPDSALALIDFWERGRAWVRGYLELGLSGEPTLWQTPGCARRSRLKRGLLPFLCPLATPDCNPDTKRWQRRAELRFRGLPVPR